MLTLFLMPVNDCRPGMLCSFCLARRLLLHGPALVLWACPKYSIYLFIRLPFRLHNPSDTIFKPVVSARALGSHKPAGYIIESGI